VKEESKEQQRRGRIVGVV